MHSDMLRTSKATFFCGQQTDTVDFNETYRRFRQIHSYTQKNNFKGDDNNNFVVLDYNPATEFNSSNFLGHFIYGIESKHIQHVVSDGKLIVENRKLTTVNEKDIKAKSQELSKQLWYSMHK